MQFRDGPAITLEGHVLTTPIEFQHTIAREVYFQDQKLVHIYQHCPQSNAEQEQVIETKSYGTVKSVKKVYNCRLFCSFVHSS